VRID
jgi:hypothetical protein